MKCYEINKYRLYDYVDGILEAPEAEKIARHLASCVECRNEERILRSIVFEISRLPATAEAGTDLWPSIQARMQESEPFVSLLAESLARRQLSIATTLVSRNIFRIADLDPGDENAAALLSYFAQWMHLTGSAHIEFAGFSNLTLLKSTYRKFPENRRHLRLIDCVHLRLAAGFVALHTEQYDAAIRHFLFVPASEADLFARDAQNEDADLLAVALHAAGHAYRRKGEYKTALSRTEEAINIAIHHNRPEMAAGFLVSKGWLLFQLDRPSEAEVLFDRAEQVLEANGDHLSVGNIKSAVARIRQRQGMYDEAVDLQLTAINRYEKCDRRHGNIARSLVNIALLQRFISLRELPNAQAGRVKADVIDAFRQEAFCNLEKAEAIYASRQDYRGRGNVRLVRAFIHMDQQRYEEALMEARESCNLGKQNRDYVLTARSLILLSRLENLKNPPGNSHGLQTQDLYPGGARRLAQDAVEAAERTQDQRLIAHSYIWLGVALLETCLPDVAEAQECYAKASALLARSLFQNDAAREMRALPVESPFQGGLFRPRHVQRRRAGVGDWIGDELKLLETKLNINRQPDAPDNSADIQSAVSGGNQ